MLSEFKGHADFVPGEIRLVPGIESVASFEEVITAIRTHILKVLLLPSATCPHVSEHIAKQHETFYVLSDVKVNSIVVASSKDF